MPSSAQWYMKRMHASVHTFHVPVRSSQVLLMLAHCGLALVRIFGEKITKNPLEKYN